MSFRFLIEERPDDHDKKLCFVFKLCFYNRYYVFVSHRPSKRPLPLEIRG